MSWKNLFSRNDLLRLLSVRGFVFCINEDFVPLTDKITNKEKWDNNRNFQQRKLLKIIEDQPDIFDFVYKLLDFIIKDSRNFKIKCSEGPDSQAVMAWEQRHFSDKLQDIKEYSKKYIGDVDLKKIITIFFKAMPEIFLENLCSDGNSFFVSPNEYDRLYFLSKNQTEKDRLYATLEADDSEFIKSWFDLLS